MRLTRCHEGRVTANKQMFVDGFVAPADWWREGLVKNTLRGGLAAPVEVLLDTGANISGIPLALAKELNLVHKDQKPIITNDGESLKRIYEVDIRILLPHPRGETDAMGDVPSKYFRRVRVMEAYGEINRIILGMDIITQGELRVKGDNFTLWL